MKYSLNKEGLLFTVTEIFSDYVLCDNGRFTYKRLKNNAGLIPEKWIVKDDRGGDFVFNRLNQNVNGLKLISVQDNSITVENSKQNKQVFIVIICIIFVVTKTL